MNTQSLRQYHRSLVLKLISKGVSTRPELADSIGLSSMGITRIVNELIKANLVSTHGKQPLAAGGPGRHSARLKINPDGAYFLGVTVSAFTNELVCINAIGDVVAKKRLSYDDMSDADTVVSSIKIAIDKLLIEENVDKARVLGIGAAIAGIVDQATGTITQASYIGWENVSFTSKLKRATGFDVTIENLANSLNMSEHRFGVARNYTSTLLVSGGTTCGSSFAASGSALRGHTFEAGQLGHALAAPSDLTCACGRIDCLNTIASGWSVLVRSGRISNRTFKGACTNHYAELLADLLASKPTENDAALLREAGENLAHATSEACLHFNPSLVLVVGAMAASNDFVAGFDDAWKTVRLNNISTKPARIFKAEPQIGSAAHLAMDEYFLSPKLDLTRFYGSAERSHVG